MKIYPKKDIENVFGNIIWYKSKTYECTQLEVDPSEFYISEPILYIVTCELYGNEYPIMTMQEIMRDFYTIEDQRDMLINTVLK